MPTTPLSILLICNCIAAIVNASLFYILVREFKSRQANAWRQKQAETAPRYPRAGK